MMSLPGLDEGTTKPVNGKTMSAGPLKTHNRAIF
jgi:hypothetical protein